MASRASRPGPPAGHPLKAVLLTRFGPTDNLEYADHPEPKPGEGEVLVRVRACALNHLDLWIRGGIPAYKITLPHILGSDISGEVAALGDPIAPPGPSPRTAGSGVVPAALGPGAKNLKVGERVLLLPGKSCFKCGPCARGQDNLCESYGILGATGGPGGYAEYVAAPAGCVFPIPGRLTFVAAASLPLTLLTAWHMLKDRARLEAGQWVLILGAGSGVGVAAIQVAKHLKARVLAASTSPEKLEKARALGADEVLELPRENLLKRALQVTGGAGFDVAFEHVGPATFPTALKALRKGGTLVTCGATTGPSVQLDLRYLFSRELNLLGSTMGTRKDFEEVLRAVEGGGLKPVVDSVFPLRDALAAHEHLAQGKQFGKVVLAV